MTDKKTDTKKERSKVKTFPVPIPFEEIKGNIILSTSNSNQFYQINIINKALNLQSKGNIKEAIKYYDLIIKEGYKDYRVFFNYAIILKNQGRLVEARNLLEKVIKTNPDHYQAHHSLGNILRQFGEYEDAEKKIRKAIKIKFNYAEAHNSLGNILQDLGKSKEAEISIRKAIKYSPKASIPYSNLGNILKGYGRISQAFNYYLKAIKCDETISFNYVLITQLLRDEDLSDIKKKDIKDIINILLRRNDIAHKYLFNAFNSLYEKDLNDCLKKTDNDFLEDGLSKKLINDNLIHMALKKIDFRDKDWEQFLTLIRAKIAHKISKSKHLLTESNISFIFCLAEQCFLNEYVYSLTENEKLSVNKIMNKCIKGDLNEINISILACYKPLYKLLDEIPLLKDFKSSKESFNQLIKLQIKEPLEEVKITKNIKRVGSIKDNVSKKVKSQYEINPYPRWRYSYNPKQEKNSSTQIINNDIFPNYIKCKSEANPLRVLIAGCGTGSHIFLAQRYKNAKITGIDLSSTSLAYAQRKINENGIKNVELIQMDILEVSLLKKRFDIIECGGVLHHMNDPHKGLKSLLEVLRENGFIFIALYSELGRKDIAEARKYISDNKLNANDNDIRSFREMIFSVRSLRKNKLFKRSDFYTISSCRDLCFHFQEHRFNINQLNEMIRSNQLNFHGFLLPKAVKSVYHKYFPEDKLQTNLVNWSLFEKQYPDTFSNMYQFWLSKK